MKIICERRGENWIASYGGYAWPWTSRVRREDAIAYLLYTTEECIKRDGQAKFAALREASKLPETKP